MAITQSGKPAITDSDFDAKAQNDAVSKWASLVQRKLRDRTFWFDHGKQGTSNRPGRIEKNLGDSIKSVTKKQYGVIDRLTYSFERHGVFGHKGVGRGYEMQGDRRFALPNRMTLQPVNRPGGETIRVHVCQ